MTKRPAGVVVAAVLLGSIALMLSFSAVGVLLTSLLMHTPQLKNGAAVRVVLAVIGILFAAMAAFDWCVVAGLFRTRNWARISIIVLGILLVLFCCGMLALLLVVIPAAQNHAGAPPPPLPHAMFAINGVLYGLLAALGVWWAVYFSLRPVRVFFSERGKLANDAPMDGSQPLAPPEQCSSDIGPARVIVLIYAVQVLFGSLMTLGFTALHLPFFFAGLLLHGEAAFFVYLLFFAIHIFIGIGLFRRLRPAYYVAIVFQLAGACSFLTLLAPSVRARALLYMQEISSRMHMGAANAPPPASFAHIQTVIYLYVGILTLVLLAIYLWGLLRDLASLPRMDAAFADPTK